MQIARLSLFGVNTNCDMLHTLALPPFLGFGECAVPLSPSSDQLNPLVLVVVGLRTEDTVLEPETVQRKAGCNKLSKR
jgi:hypothetical protein